MLRVYPSCNIEGCTKDDIVKDKQRHKGLGFKSIRRFLNCSQLLPITELKRTASFIEPLRSKKEIEVAELDEMHAYNWLKKLLLIAMESNSPTAKLLQ